MKVTITVETDRHKELRLKYLKILKKQYLNGNISRKEYKKEKKSTR